MLRSMTAFARRETQQEWGSATWELRAVNHRYLDIVTRLPEEVRALEQEIRARVSTQAKRGKIECSMRIHLIPVDSNGISLNQDLVKLLAQASREIDQTLYNPSPVNSMDIIRWPGVLQITPPDQETMGKAILKSLDEALGDLVETREREGDKIRDFLLMRLDEIQPHIETVRASLPGIIENIRERLTTRLAVLHGDVDENRLEQEITIYAQKLDVAEELDRLDSHVQEVCRVLDENRPMGRRLDFLMQELNREANTLSSKSASSDTTKAAVELKVLIEQMREQIQNVE